MDQNRNINSNPDPWVHNTEQLQLQSLDHLSKIDIKREMNEGVGAVAQALGSLPCMS